MRKPRYLAPPSMMLVRALVPTIVISDWMTRSLPTLIVPAGTLIVSGVLLVPSAAAIAVRRLKHVWAVAVPAGVVASLEPLVTLHVSAWAGAANASAASTAREAVPKRILSRH